MKNPRKSCFVELFFRKQNKNSIIKLKGSQNRVKEYKNVEGVDPEIDFINNLEKMTKLYLM